MRRTPLPRLVIALALLATGVAIDSGAAAAAAPTAWVVNENARPGTSAWRIRRGAPQDIQGFADHVSAVPGARVKLYIDTTAASFHVVAFRLGYYQGLGGRRIWHSHEHAGIVQPAATTDPDTHMVETSWQRSMTFRVDDTWVQGSYLLKLVASTGGQSYIPLVIRDDTSTAALVIQHQVFTWQAYNDWGGASLYHGPDGTFPTRSRVVSFDRPYAGRGAGSMLRALPLISLVEQDGMDVTYSTDLDLEQRPALLRNHRSLITLNHDEYWSTGMRDAVESARSAGVNLVNLGANAIFRHIRLQDSPLGADRRVVCYKIRKEDPLNGVDNAEVTVNWREAPLHDPESAVLGSMYTCDRVSHVDLVVSDASAWPFAGTGLQDGDVIAGAINEEYDRVFPDAPTPASIQVLAHSPVNCHGHPNVADTTYYTASSGAGVVNLGTLGWLATLACGPPVQDTWCSAAATQITRTLLTEAANGPLGDAHPAMPNATDFGYQLTRPTYP
jgi:hypothetical protein